MTLFAKKAVIATIAVYTLTSSSSSSSVLAAPVEKCPGYGSVTVISASAPTKSQLLDDSFEAFRQLLGGDAPNGNGNTDPPIEGGHRQINWDAPGTILPFDMPGDFFATTVPRGIQFHSDTNEFRVSDDGITSDKLFDSINPDAAQNFLTFSPQRLFTPVGGNKNEIFITFEVPASTIPATVAGFGAIFVDVDLEYTTKMTLYAESGCVIAEEFAKPGGLSFLGVISGEYAPDIYSIEMEYGTHALDFKWNGWGQPPQAQGGVDFVVMDDFIYSEPKAIVA